MEPTLPTIHLNGTGAATLEAEYQAVRLAVAAAADKLAAATLNLRDFYPQHPDSWDQAKAERAEMLGALGRVEAFAEAWEIHAAEQRRIREGR
jgi:hypothetical protein